MSGDFGEFGLLGEVGVAGLVLVVPEFGSVAECLGEGGEERELW